MPDPLHILGISCDYHDSAAALLRDGEIVFAAQEERFSRHKGDESFPRESVRRALDFAGIDVSDLAAIAYYEKPLLKFIDRILHTFFKVWPRGFRAYHRAMREWMTHKLFIQSRIRTELDFQGEILTVPHHVSHAAGTFYASGFDEAAILTADGVGEWATTSISHGRGVDLLPHKEIRFPHSLGLLYSAITHHLGFDVNADEYKVMGLAPYGSPRLLPQLQKLLDVRSDGSFALRMEYFEYEHGLRMCGRRMAELLGEPRRQPDGEITRFHQDLARSIQDLLEERMLALAAEARREVGASRLCLSGGVALNCVANARILRSGLFDDVFIQPASGDAGSALGAALAVWHMRFGGSRLPRLDHVFLGPGYDAGEIQRVLDARRIPYERLDPEAVAERTAKRIADDRVVGWFQGRMEFGPRALGARSILADPRNAENWQRVNRKIKFRESFRPFAPTVLQEAASDYFDIDRESPFMLLVADVLPARRADIPAVTHVDGSARLQTLRRDQHPRFHELLRCFQRQTGCPVVINTSFNVRDEPIVERPEDALDCFLRTQMDDLVLGEFLVDKENLMATRAARPPGDGKPWAP